MIHEGRMVQQLALLIVGHDIIAAGTITVNSVLIAEVAAAGFSARTLNSYIWVVP